MSSDLTRSTSTAPGLSLKNKIGLGLAGLLGLGDTLSVFIVPWPGPGEADPPFAAFVADSVLGLITLVAVVYAWRSRSRVGGRIVAGSRILWTIIALPAFFIEGNPSTFIVLVAVLVVVTVVTVGLVLSRPGGPDQIT
ncbi:MAG TPA: hypothetical protein VIY28_05290 [Pseudonocardiaceae bacterium]